MCLELAVLRSEKLLPREPRAPHLESGAQSPKLEKALTQQQRPSTAKKKKTQTHRSRKQTQGDQKGEGVGEG